MATTRRRSRSTKKAEAPKTEETIVPLESEKEPTDQAGQEVEETEAVVVEAEVVNDSELVVAFGAQEEVLSAEEEAERERLEHKILKAYVESFVAAGEALGEINEKKLYKGYGSFERYVEERLGYSRIRAYQMIRAAKVFKILEEKKNQDDTIKILPTSEFQIRPLVRYREEPEKLVEAWKQVLDKAKDKPPTEKQVKGTVVELETSKKDSRMFEKGELVRILKTEGESQLQGQGNFRGYVTKGGNFSVNVQTAYGLSKNIHPQYIERLSEQKDLAEEEIEGLKQLIDRLHKIYAKRKGNRLIGRIVTTLAVEDSLEEFEAQILNAIEAR